MRIGLTLAIAIAFLTGCSRARLITEVHNDGGFTRTLALTGQDKKNSQGSMGDAIEAAVLTVTKTLQSIAVTPTAASVAVGATQQFTAIGTYSDGTTANITTTVNWNSSNTSVATIAATYSDGSTVNITNSVTWSSSNTTTATIAATGLATGLAKGTTNITATLNGITSNTAVLTVTVASGEPAVTITLLDQSSTGPGFYVDLQVTNTGVGPASNLSINQITFRTIGGTGTVTQVSPALPIAVGALAPSASTTIRVFLNVTSTVTRFSMGEAGTVQDTNATTFNYAWPAVAKRNLPNSTPSSRNVRRKKRKPTKQQPKQQQRRHPTPPLPSPHQHEPPPRPLLHKMALNLQIRPQPRPSPPSPIVPTLIPAEPPSNSTPTRQKGGSTKTNATKSRNTKRTRPTVRLTLTPDVCPLAGSRRLPSFVS